MEQNAVKKRKQETVFSFFEGGITTTRSNRVKTLSEVFCNITTESRYGEKTRAVREAKDRNEHDQKKRILDYVTFSGVFHPTRSNANLLRHSGLICIDIDHIGNEEAVKEAKKGLIADGVLKVLLMFISPSGDGLKVVTEIDLGQCDHETWYKAISNYLLVNHRLEADPSCKDVSRPCFLCYDPEAYISPDILPF